MLSDFWIKIILHQIKIACNDWWCDFSSWLPNKNACINFYYIDQGPVAEFIFWYHFKSLWFLARRAPSLPHTFDGTSESEAWRWDLNRGLWIQNRIYAGDDFSMVITRSILRFTIIILHDIIICLSTHYTKYHNHRLDKMVKALQYYNFGEYYLIFIINLSWLSVAGCNCALGIGCN